MQQRYALRFESGERRGELIPIPGTGVTAGRRPGNSVQILDGSVSGRHAEFVVDDLGVTLRDLGSTNGTRVAGERVSERRLAHGDDVLLGNVRMAFVDTSLDDGAEEPAARAPAAAPVAGGTGGQGDARAAGDGVHTISADKLARSSKSSLVLLIGGAVVLAAGGGLWWWTNQGGGEGKQRTVRAVVPVDGNLLADSYSFEGDGTGWESSEAAPGFFGQDAGARHTGESGLLADLVDGEWAQQQSPAVRVTGGRGLIATGWLRRSGQVAVLLGVEFESSTAVGQPLSVWAPAVDAEDWQEVVFETDVPPGYDRARVLLLGRTPKAAAGIPPADEGTGGGAAAGTAEADDVSLLPGTARGPAGTVGEYRLSLLGAPATAATLFKIDRVLFSGLRVTEGGTTAAAPRRTLSAESSETGVRLTVGGPASGGAGTTLSLYAESVLAASGIATMGEGGYRTHQVQFERAAVSGLLLGAGRDLVQISFEQPLELRGRPDGEGFRFDAKLGANAGAKVQLSFLAERNEAQILARRARQAEGQGQVGDALEAWTKLLDEYPYEPELLKEGEANRGRLVEAGLREVQGLKEQVERARFFRLVDLYRQCHERALELAARYEPSEVQGAALDLARDVAGDLGLLEADLDTVEKGRLEAILRTLEAGQNPKLSERVRAYLQEHFAAPKVSGR